MDTGEDIIASLRVALDDISEKQFTAEEGSYLGRGGFGSVFRVHDSKRGTHVAVKKVGLSEGDSLHARRVLREVYLMNHFCTKGHPFIVTLHEIFYSKATDSMLFIMELVEYDLAKVFANDTPLSLEHIRNYIAQITFGLHYIHEAGVIHRDLKPSNILISSRGVIKICDFGLGRSINGSLLSSYVMTRPWRAPEVLLETLNYTSSVDVWSLGCILAQMFNRRQSPDTMRCSYHVLFPGKSSPMMIDLIMEFVGTVSEEVICKLGNQNTQTHLRSYPQAPPVDLSVWLHCPDMSVPPADAIDLIWQMLSFDPDARITTKQALEHPFLRQYFQNIDPEFVSRFQPTLFMEPPEENGASSSETSIDDDPEPNGDDEDGWNDTNSEKFWCPTSPDTAESGRGNSG